MRIWCAILDKVHAIRRRAWRRRGYDEAVGAHRGRARGRHGGSVERGVGPRAGAVSAARPL